MNICVPFHERVMTEHLLIKYHSRRLNKFIAHVSSANLNRNQTQKSDWENKSKSGRSILSMGYMIEKAVRENVLSFTLMITLKNECKHGLKSKVAAQVKYYSM